MFQAVPPPIIRSSKLYVQHRVFVELFLLLTAIVSELSSCWLYLNILTMHGPINVKNKKKSLLLSHGKDGYAKASNYYFYNVCLFIFRLMQRYKLFYIHLFIAFITTCFGR
jgi:hypothetical protein